MNRCRRAAFLGLCCLKLVIFSENGRLNGE
jgi:hypothetical protein